MSKIHLINKQGERITIENCEWEDAKLQPNNKYAGYTMDMDWYLSHGYSLAEDVFKRIESQRKDVKFS